MMNTREEWLVAAADLLRVHIEAQAGRELPPVSVTCGWPSTGGTARTRRVIGQCWDADCSADGKHAIFISPVLEAAGEMGALATLTHELVHALVGVEAKHKGPFAKAARAVGLLGKPTATTAGPTLQDLFATIQGKLGEYPHGALTPKQKEKPQGTRMLKMECGTCGYVARTTKKWLEAAGPLRCPCDPNVPMTVEEPDTDPDADPDEPTPEYTREPERPEVYVDPAEFEDRGLAAPVRDAEHAEALLILKAAEAEDAEAEDAEEEEVPACSNCGHEALHGKNSGCLIIGCTCQGEAAQFLGTPAKACWACDRDLDPAVMENGDACPSCGAACVGMED